MYTVSTKVNASFHHAVEPKYGYFRLFCWRKVQYGHWYVQTKPMTTFRRTFQTRFRNKLPARPITFTNIENYSNLGNVEKITGRCRPAGFEQTVHIVNSYFCQHWARSLRREVAGLGTPYSTIQNIGEPVSHVSVQRKTSTWVTTTRIRSTNCQFLFLHDQSFIRFWLPRWDRLFDRCVFHDSGFANTQRTRTWCKEIPREIQQPDLQSEMVTVWCAM